MVLRMWEAMDMQMVDLGIIGFIDKYSVYY